jgi:hypothetical protein
MAACLNKLFFIAPATQGEQKFPQAWHSSAAYQRTRAIGNKYATFRCRRGRAAIAAPVCCDFWGRPELPSLSPKPFEKREEDMNRRSLLTTWVPTILAAALLPTSVVAQEISLKELVGSWIFVSAQDVKPDGSKVDPWGPNPKGAAMYDANGRFTFMIMRSDLPKFPSNNRAQATAEGREGCGARYDRILWARTRLTRATRPSPHALRGVHTRTSSAANKSASLPC